jgi:hypothetical protein
LGIILENKNVRKLELEKKLSPKLIFLNEKEMKKNRLFFDIEKLLLKYNLGTF